MHAAADAEWRQLTALPMRVEYRCLKRSVHDAYARKASIVMTKENPVAKATRPAKKSTSAVQTLIDGLNSDLSGEYNAIISYITYSAKMIGPYRPELVTFLQAEIPDETAHAQYLSDKIAALGGEPTVVPRPVPVSDDPRELLQFIYEAEAQTIENYRERLGQAEAAGEIGLKIQLEDIIQDETRHRDETKKILNGWKAGS
jgi:bacterioferritin